MSCGTPLRLGLDIGTLYVKAVLLQDSGSTIKKKYFRPHQGHPIQNIREIFNDFGVYATQTHLGVTGANANILAHFTKPLNPVKALRLAVLKRFPDVRNIIDVGGCSVTMICLDEKGNFVNFTNNSLCAAGTGSFLDQQAERMGISYDDSYGFSSVEEPPAIATRCAVFAKTDLIHRQQEGYSRDALWSGLCKGMTNTFIQILLRGKKLEGCTVLTGGVALNREIIRWLKEKFGDSIQLYPDPVFAQAIGSALATNNSPVVIPAHIEELPDSETIPLRGVNLKEDSDFGEYPDKDSKIDTTKESRPPLVLKRTTYPDFSVLEEWIDDYKNEIRILKSLTNKESLDGSQSKHGNEKFRTLRGYLGIDIGSTSSKLAFVDEKEDVVLDVYRKTSGDPVGALQELFKAFRYIELSKNVEFKVLGSATTGSGRKLVGTLIGADCIVNEITAHAEGTRKVDPEIETIFEIGGQDSKYIHLKNGQIAQCNMNYVCAAGTGSFIEEQALKLGFKVQEIGSRVMGLSAPQSSERCTVFMEQDINNLLVQGYEKEEVIAAVLYSVAQNYLVKVVGKRPVTGKKVFFQGATARNKALVAAFEQILNKEIAVSPLCHIMGAYGAALFAKKMQINATNFKGFDLFKKKIALSYERCDVCTNQCKITYAQIENSDNVPSWGYMCGKDPDEKKKRKVPGFAPFQKRRSLLARMGTVPVKNPIATFGVPRTLINFSYLPMWKKFLGELGIRIILSPPTGETTVEKGIESTGADFCFPIKSAHGHIVHLLKSDRIDKIFLPHMISYVPDRSSYTMSYFCPYVQGFSSVVKQAFNDNNRNGGQKEIISPVIDFHWTEKRIVSELYSVFGKDYGISRKKVHKAWIEAVKVQKEFFTAIQKEGKKFIENLNGKGIVVIGRPYNTVDEKLSMNIPYKFAETFGLTVLPVDMIPFEPGEIDSDFKMFWNYGKIILNGLKFVRTHPDWHGVFLSNFGCGPDSHLLSYAEEIMEDKPLLILELDEHGSDGGYQTRMEAFMDAVNSFSPKSYKKFNFSITNEKRELSGRTIWVPPMHPVSSRLFASAFKRYGFDAQALPPETPEILETGNKLVRGSECLPTSLTIGGFVHKLRELKADPAKHALFMPTSDGPCRLGQYIVIQRLILNRLGFKDTTIVSPSANNAYMGLPEDMRPFLWKIVLVSDIIFKIKCRIKPYEKQKGATDKAFNECIQFMEEAISQGEDIYAAFEESLKAFRRIERTDVVKPLVGIVGEIYIRCNPFSNNNVIQAIEDAGGEAWLSPISEWILNTGFMSKWHNRRNGDIKELVKAYLKNRFFHKEERKMNEMAGELLINRQEPDIKKIILKGAEYLPIAFGTEAILTIGRASLFVDQGVSLIVNASPFTCMPGTISAAIFTHIQNEMGVPVVNFFYDGKSGESDPIKTYIENLSPVHH